MSHNTQNKIAVINDFCGFGKCSLAVSIPVISALKVQCCPVPTAIFSNHTAYQSFFCTDFTQHIKAYIHQWKKLDLKFQGILTGFLGSLEQIKIIEDFFTAFKMPQTKVIIDPVMGDDGKLYPTYSVALAQKMKHLVHHADILTPNFTEACILTDTPYIENPDFDYILKICLKLNKMGPDKIVISGLERGDDLDNFIFEKGKEPEIYTQHKVGPCRCGTGDVFSSIIAADAVNGMDFADSVKHACMFIEKALRRTVELNVPMADGICFEDFLKEL